jgi:hypothetical protein
MILLKNIDGIGTTETKFRVLESSNSLLVIEAERISIHNNLELTLEDKNKEWVFKACFIFMDVKVAKLECLTDEGKIMFNLVEDISHEIKTSINIFDDFEGNIWHPELQDYVWINEPRIEYSTGFLLLCTEPDTFENVFSDVLKRPKRSFWSKVRYKLKKYFKLQTLF